MDEKQLQALFDEMKSKLELGDFATFKNQIGSDEKFRKAFYNEASVDLDLGDFNVFNESFKKKVSTTPSAKPAPVSGPAPAPASPSKLPSPSGLTYNDIELVIEDTRKKARRLQDLKESPGSSAGIGAPGTIIPKPTLDLAAQELQLAEKKKKEVLTQYQNELSRPVERLIETGEYKGFFTQDGVFDEAKARNHFKKVTQKFGGGSHLQDQWLVNLKTRGQQEIDKPRFNQILGEEMKNQNLDLTQYSTQVFNQLTQQQRATADSLKKERDTEALKLLNSAEAKAKQYAEELNKAVNSLNDQIKAGLITNEAAAAAYDQLVKQYETTIKGIDNGYKDAIRRMNVRINGKFDRIEQEVKAINASIDGDKIMQSLPPDVRKRLEQAYQNAGQRLSTEKNEARKKLDTVTGIGTTDAVSRTVNLALKGLTSGFNRGLADVGEYLNMKGLSGSFVDALRNRRTAAETFAPAQYEWNKDEWLKRAVSSTATSLGASAPILLPTIGAVALTGGGAAGALGAGALSFAGESAQIGGGQFREGLEETGDVGAATQRSEEVMRQNMITAPLYFIGGLGDVMITTGKGLSKVATGVALEQVEEIPTEYIQSFNEAKAKGYKKGIGDFIKENPEIAADTFISTVGQSGAMKGISSAFSVFQKNVPASTTQMLTDAVSKNGVEFTNGLIDKWFEAGKINEKTVAKLKAEVTKIQSQLPKLQEAGVDGDKAKLMSSLSSQAQELQNKINAEKDPAVKALYQNQLNVVNQDISQLVKGETPYVVFKLPGGGDMTRVMTVREFNALPAESSNDMVKNSDGIQVVGDDALNTQLTQKKQELGVPDAAPGVFTQAAPQAPAVPEIEAKRADIEKRRQEELDSVDIAKGGKLPIEGYEEFYKNVNAKYDAELAALESTSSAAELTKTEKKTPETIEVSGDATEFANQMQSAQSGLGKAGQVKPIADRLRTEIFGDTKQKVDSAQKALEKTGVVINMITDPAEFDSRVTQLGGQRGMEGVFLSDTGEILINQQKLDQGIADGRVIWHEASHPVVNIVRNTNPQLFGQVVAGLRQAAANNKGVAGALAWAESQYAQDGQGTIDDEAVVETIAGIAEGMIDITKLPTGLKQSIIDLINRIARALGFDQVLDDTDIAAFKKLASDIANALTTGQDISEVVGAENVKEYLNTVETPGLVTGGELAPAAQARITTEPAVSVYDSKEVSALPQKSLEEVYNQFDGKAVVINSDPTRVGELTLPSGKKIFMYGGPAYLSIKDNVDANVGFATTQTSKVNTWMKYVKEVFGDNPGVTLVASQAPTSILSNSYALRYVMDAISMLPKSVLRSSDFKNEFFGKDLVLLKDAFGEKAYNEFVNKYKKADLSDPKVIDDMIAEMGYKVGDDNKPASFKARGAFVSNLVGGIADKASLKGVEGDKGYVSKKPNKYIAKQLMDRLGVNAEKIMREIGEPSLVDLYMNEGNWGFAVAGFETDPNMTVESVQQGGVKHPLFNAKFPGKNPFILDGAYELNKMFTPVEITGPSGMPYTKTAAQMLAGSMYVKGQPLAEGGSFEYVRTSPAGRRIQARAGRPVVGQIDWQRSPEGKGDPSISARSKMVTQAAADLRDGKITNEEYRATVSENSPIMPITRFFEPATEAEVERSLDKNQAMKANTPVEDGTKVGLRLDIPAYKNNNTWVVSVHEGDNKAGKAISYRNVARITDVRFGVEPKASLNIAAGLGKAPINRIYGKWKNIPGTSMTEQAENAKALVQEIVDDPNYVQVGMNPFRHSYFYDRNTDIGRPIVSADEVIQVGGLVYAKNPVYGNWTDESYRVKGMLDAAGAPVQFSRGNRLAPNGKPSNLTEQQYNQVRTPEFKNWFGDWENDPANASKVVDENGEPLVVYHGGFKNIEEFMTPLSEGYASKTRKDDYTGNYGIYFTPSKKVAKGYINSKIGGIGIRLLKPSKVKQLWDNSDIYEVFLNIKNPLDKNIWSKWKFGADKIYNKEYEVVQEKGSDGIIQKTTFGGTSLDQIVVFNPNQIKSATDNTGAFSTTDNRIQASRGNRMESSKDFKLAAFVMREKADGAPMSEIVSGIASVFPNMSPQEIKDLVDDPETWLRNKYANLSKAMQDNLIARARVKNIYAPRTGAVAPAFQGLEVPMSKIEEATQAPTFKERVDKVFTNFKNKFIDPAKGLPDWIISLKDFAGGTKQIEISRAELTIRQLKEVAKKIGFTDWDTFAAALKSIPQPIQKPVGSGAGMVAFNPSVAAAGAPYTIPNSMLPQTTPPAVQALPLEIIPFVYKMRGQIDGLTKDLIASGYVTPEQAAKLESNIGQYVNRAYRLYNEKGWRPDQDQIREATKFLADQYIKQLATDNAGVLTYEQVEKQAIEKAKRDVNEILDKKTNPYFAAKSESRNMGILKERKDIPEPIRKLMGEYTDPGTVFIMTVAKQAALKASSEYLTKVRNMGMGTLFFEENDPNRPASASVQIAAEGSDTKSPLNGLYTMTEVAEAMETVNPTYNEVVNLWMKAVGAVRWGKTVGSVKTQLLNFESNLGFAVMNGLLMTGATGKAFNESRKYVGGQYSNKELSDITQKVIQLGLVGQGVNATELAKMLGSGDIHDIALDLAVNPDSKYRMAKKAPGKALGVLNKLYRMGDDFWKVYAYMNERELVAGAMFDKKYADLTDQEQADVDIESSERVKSTWPTYDRVFPAVKAISQNTPIFGNFISFRAESIRVLANSIAMAIKDLKTPGFEGLGARRMAGILSYIAIRSGVTYAFAQAAGMAASGLTGLMFGGDDEEERKKRAIKQAAPSFMATQDIAVIPTKEKHKFIVYSLSGIDPYNTTFNTINALTDGTATKKPGPAAAFSEFFGGFLSPEMTFNTAWSVLTNTNSKNGDRIVGDTDEGADAYAKIGAYLFDELKPSTIGMVQRLAGDNPSAELASLVGARPYEVDLHKSFSFALSDMGKQMEEVSKAYNRVKYNEKSTADDKALAQKEAEQKKALLIERMNQRFNDYVLLGADPAELRKIILERSQIKTTGFDKQTKIGIINGNVNPESLYK